MPSFSAILHALTAFVAAHPGGAAWLAATLVAVYRSRTPAQWIALGESNPRLQGLFKLARGGGLDPAKLLEGAAQVATGRVAVDPRDARIAELEAALATYQRRTADAAEHDLSRPTTAPPAPIAPTPLRAVTLTGVAAADATQAQYESARAFRERALPFDAAARQEIAPEVVAAARAASERGDE